MKPFFAGHNGAGKTTLLNLLTGLLPVDATADASTGASVYGHELFGSSKSDAARRLLGVCQKRRSF